MCDHLIIKLTLASLDADSDIFKFQLQWFEYVGNLKKKNFFVPFPYFAHLFLVST